MSLYPVALALVCLVEAVLLARRHLLPWLRRRRTVVDWCEVCNKGLTRSSVRELRSDADDDDELIPGGSMGGGTYMVATYCRRHFPR